MGSVVLVALVVLVVLVVFVVLVFVVLAESVELVVSDVLVVFVVPLELFVGVTSAPEVSVVKVLSNEQRANRGKKSMVLNNRPSLVEVSLVVESIVPKLHLLAQAFNAFGVLSDRFCRFLTATARSNVSSMRVELSLASPKLVSSAELSDAPGVFFLSAY